MLNTVWDLRSNVSIYDAAYLAVARLRGAQLVTFDQRLARGAEYSRSNVGVRVLQT